MKTKLLPLILMIVAIAVAVVSFVLLPDTVITQLGSGAPTTMSKPFAVLLPTAISVIPSLLCLTDGENTRRRGSYLLLGFVGILVLVVMLAVNLL